MGNYVMIDVSDPTAAGIKGMPAGAVAVAGYLGGDTPHVWTTQEWARFDGWRKLPIWTRTKDNSPQDGIADAWAAVKQLGMVASWQQGATYSPIALDLETYTDPAYVTAFAAIAEFCGHPVYPYGSKSTITGNPECWGYWIADWTNTEHLVPGSMITQYQPAGSAGSGPVAPFDRSQLSAAAFNQIRVW